MGKYKYEYKCDICNKIGIMEFDRPLRKLEIVSCPKFHQLVCVKTARENEKGKLASIHNGMYAVECPYPDCGWVNFIRTKRAWTAHVPDVNWFQKLFKKELEPEETKIRCRKCGRIFHVYVKHQ